MSAMMRSKKPPLPVYKDPNRSVGNDWLTQPVGR
jgi:hypothetical protein